ncbi:MAG TPA: hypothetical protein VF704_11925 [Allosphingosinicella sp.]|jgi:hypothetical protein
MTRLVKDFIEIADHMSLDGLIERLSEVRASLPEGADAQLRIRGDDIFGRHLCIAFLRPQTAEEIDCEARYAEAFEESRERELHRLHEELGFCPLPGRNHLRAVA